MDNRIKNMLVAYFCLVSAVTLWGGNWVAVRFTVQEIPPLVMVTVRTILSALILYSLMKLRKDPQPLKKDYILFAFLGLVGLFGFNYCQFAGLKYTTATNGSLVNAITPILVMLISWFLMKERLSIIQIFGALISFFGVAWVVTKGSWSVVYSLDFNIGDLMMFIGAICWAIYTIYAKKPTLRYSAISVTAYASLFAALYFTPLGIYQYQANPLVVVPSWQVIFASVYIVATAVCGLVAWNKGISMIGASRGAIFMNLMPIITVIFAFVILDEAISFYQLIGGIFVLVGVYLTTHPRFVKRVDKK